MKVHIGLGSNIGDRGKNIKAAIRLIGRKCVVGKVSRLYETEPMYYENQPWFYNAALQAETSLSALKLLDFLSGIEKSLGRKKGLRYGPRAIDLDILFYGDEIVDRKNLKIPHPMLHERLFVLLPLAEISPDLVHPASGLRIQDLLEKCSGKQIVRLLPQNYTEMVSYLFSLQRFKDAYSLGMMRQAVKMLGSPQEKIKCIHIAGTNGKGSTSVMTASILQSHGYKTGLYMSPHLIDFRERISINGRQIGRGEAWKLFRKIQSLNLSLTFFEFITAMAFEYFSQQKVDFAVIEAGLGGRLDATNVAMPLVSVITNVSLEHEGILGRTIEKIAWEKAGIIKDGRPVITACSGKALEVICKAAGKTKSEIFGPANIRGISFRDCAAGFFYRGRNITLRMKGSYQLNNAGLAIRVIEVLKSRFGLKTNIGKIKEGLENSFIPGRFEVCEMAGRRIIFDGAHNPVAVSALLNSIKGFRFKRLISVVSIMKDKNCRKMLSLLEKESGLIVLTKANSYRACNPESLASCITSKEKIKIEVDFMEALAFAKKQAAEEDLILVTGSFYLVGNIKAGLAGIVSEYPKEMPAIGNT
ncbi:MAG: 2-amino-4-hydroxy-6-hydroxymethyldihydropteridine diphosphokinase [Candidatus Aenigmarchaeota archaeon]|nr:2-amino-4-hydroxy-6-hydroxymethyldihydropteridine diphosphokinase [Candidatus Aenigmarchaeota archaeon]